MTSSHPGAAALALAAPAEDAPSRQPIDHAAVQRAARDLLRALGADVASEPLRETPRRVADAFAELLSPRPFRATTFPNDGGYELVVARPRRELEPRGVGVVLEAEHVGMSLRGVQATGARTVTSALRGAVRDDARTRQEFLVPTSRSAA